MLTTKQIEITNKKKFATIILDINNKNFMLYIAVLAKLTIILIYFSYKVLVVLLINVEIFTKYFNIFDIFSSNSKVELLKYTKINNYFINLLNNKQATYSLIYNLKLVELEILKIYIKANLVSTFIKCFNFSANALILFV